MKFKTNLVVGAVFAVLLAFVYLYEIKGGEERRQAAEQSKKILTLPINQFLTEKEIKYISNKINKFYN